MGFGLITYRHSVYGPVVALNGEKARGSPSISAMIAPALGFNLYSLRVNGRQLLWADPEQLAATGFGGTPILFPTPNRVKNARFSFAGDQVLLSKRGKPRAIHGLAYDEPFAWTGQVTDDWARATGELDFQASGTLASFPFPCKLSITYQLTSSSLTLTYTVTNTSAKPVPFGFAIHPYFVRDGLVQAQVPANLVYQSGPDRFPIALHGVDGPFDLRTPQYVDQLDLDDVYTDLYAPCELRFTQWGLGLRLNASSDLGHAVVYTPPGKPYFCIENQTCQTDAHNAYHRGEPRSGLIVLSPGGRHTGSIQFLPFDLS